MKVLQFGGGKDSLACLYLLKKQWDEITVVWMNTGTAFPEVTELMDQIRSTVPHFHEVKADVLTDIGIHGHPVDVLPIQSSNWGKLTTPDDGPLLRSYMDCCHNNFWTPLHRACMEMGATTIIRGQRVSEYYKSPVRHGDVINGITFEMPLEGWSEQDVFSFLSNAGVPIPKYYEYTNTSLDCWNCTAYLDAKRGQLNYMREHHPEKYAIVRADLRRIHASVKKHTDYLAEAAA